MPLPTPMAAHMSAEPRWTVSTDINRRVLTSGMIVDGFSSKPWYQRKAPYGSIAGEMDREFPQSYGNFIGNLTLVRALEHLDYFSHHIGFMSSSQLTNSLHHKFQRGRYSLKTTKQWWILDIFVELLGVTRTPQHSSEVPGWRLLRRWASRVETSVGNWMERAFFTGNGCWKTNPWRILTVLLYIAIYGAPWIPSRNTTNQC